MEGLLPKQKLEQKFIDHGSPQALVQLLELDEAEAVERLKKAVNSRDVAFAQGQLERIDEYRKLLKDALK